MEKRQEVNLIELMEQYNSSEACREVLEKLRWPGGIACPRCNSKTIRHSYTRDQFDCASCGYQFSVTSGTIFHDSHLPLHKWFVAVYLIVESRKGISANQLKRVLGISYKTAWYLCQRIRSAMRDAYPMPLKGVVEIDETYVGGQAKGKGAGYKGNKAVVVGAVQRDGKIYLQVTGGRDKPAIHNFVTDHISPGADTIITDDLPSYRGIDSPWRKHEIINHSQGEFSRGDLHTNSIENVWSLLKRSIVGSYHKVSVKHLDAYLDELEWRFNNRNNEYLFRDTILKLIGSESLPYQELVGSSKSN